MQIYDFSKLHKIEATLFSNKLQKPNSLSLCLINIIAAKCVYSSNDFKRNFEIKSFSKSYVRLLLEGERELATANSKLANI